MARHFWLAFCYWAKTGKRSFGYLFNKRDYHHALDRFKEEQVMKTEMEELNNNGDEESQEETES